MRQILFVGLGSFGFHCARKLEGLADVTAIDVDREAIQRIGPYVTRAVVGDGTNREVLEELGVETMDAAVVSLGDRMDASILATLHLKALNVREIFVKAISDEHAKVLQILGASRVIYPERDSAENLAMSIVQPTILDYLRLHGDISLLELLAPDEFVGKNLMQLKLRERYGITVIAIFGPGRRSVSPKPDCVIQRDDKLMVIGENENLMTFQASLERVV